MAANTLYFYILLFFCVDEIRSSLSCEKKDFDCGDGTCIYRGWRCDGDKDCSNNLDEVNCPSSSSCLKEEYACGDGTCIHRDWRCDGDEDCSNNLDEVNCHTLNANSNSNAQFKVLLDPLPNITSSVYIRKDSVLAKAKGTQWEAFGKYSTCRLSFSGNTFSGNINFILKNITIDDAGRYDILYRSGNKTYNSSVIFLLITDANITYADDGSDAVLPFNIIYNHLSVGRLKCPTGKEILYSTDGIVYNNENEKYSITTNRINEENRELYLTVKNVSSDDEGVYANKNSGAILAIYASPDKPVIVQETKLVARGPLTLSCVTKSNTVPTGFETIPMYRKWFVDDERIENNTKYIITTSFLKVASVEKDDAGKRIYCQAEESTSAPSLVSDEFKINIKFPPLITLSPPNTSYTQSEGDKMNNVTCYADCLPECRITWITSTRDYIAGPILSFRTLSREDHGSYSCIATNDEGRDVKTVFINVQYYVIKYKTNYTFVIVTIILAAILLGTICIVLFLKYRTAFFQTSESGKNERMKMTDITSTAQGGRAILNASENYRLNVCEYTMVTDITEN